VTRHIREGPWYRPPVHGGRDGGVWPAGRIFKRLCALTAARRPPVITAVGDMHLEPVRVGPRAILSRQERAGRRRFPARRRPGLQRPTAPPAPRSRNSRRIGGCCLYGEHPLGGLDTRVEKVRVHEGWHATSCYRPPTRSPTTVLHAAAWAVRTFLNLRRLRSPWLTAVGVPTRRWRLASFRTLKRLLRLSNRLEVGRGRLV
jgi:hypothetical protein